MTEWRLPDGYRNQVLLATAGHDHGPQFGPAYPREYVPRILDCGCNEEDCDGAERGSMREVPDDYDFWLGQ